MILEFTVSQTIYGKPSQFHLRLLNGKRNASPLNFFSELKGRAIETTVEFFLGLLRE